jgi:hypothetical protein
LNSSIGATIWIGGLLVEIGDHDAGALAHEDNGDLLADAAGGTGHDGNLVLEAHVTTPLRLRG